MKTIKRLVAVAIALVCTLSFAFSAFAVDKSSLQSDVDVSAAYMYKTVSNPQIGSIGGEWAVIGLARSGYNIPSAFYKKYYAAVEEYVKEHEGVLNARKYTEYSRVAIALTAIGKDPTNVAGYNLLTPLGDYDKTIWQGLNGPIWALIALDSGGYAIPKNKNATNQAIRQMYVDRILACQLENGGWSLSVTGGNSVSADPDITGMALQALSKYMNDENVKVAVDKALAYLSEAQDASGGFSSGGEATSESIAQVIVGLCELGVSIEDTRFVKNGSTLLDNLLTYRKSDGSFVHNAFGDTNQMATEQGFYAIVAVLRLLEGEDSLYKIKESVDTKESYALEQSDLLIQPLSVVTSAETAQVLYNMLKKANLL